MEFARAGRRIPGLAGQRCGTVDIEEVERVDAGPTLHLFACPATWTLATVVLSSPLSPLGIQRSRRRIAAGSGGSLSVRPAAMRESEPTRP